MPRLSCLLVALLGLSWWGVSAAAVAAVPVQLTEAVTLLRGRFVAGSQPDGNSVLLRGPDGVIVFDAGRHPEHADALLDSLKGAAAASVVLVNSHWHLDHSGG
ncbi:MAG: MBL fold metallo-hydrolase, partial [Xanthomonadales bacterium]|nr:MBL fold metallo-hydrolase [Xanthomonadales bacterium]